MDTKPYDKYHLVYMILVVHGIGTLLPWNMLINADSYFVDYKLNVTNASPVLANYRTNFLSYLGIASKAPNIMLQIINMFANSNHGSLSIRIIVTLIIQAIVFVLTIVLAILDSSEWAELFFWLTMLSAVVINIANGVYQGCVYGSAAKLPMHYTNSVTVGMNLSGTIAALFMIISIAIAPNPKLVAIYFFSFAVIILMLCVITEIYIRRNKFYTYYMMKEKQQITDSDQILTINISEDHTHNGNQHNGNTKVVDDVTHNLNKKQQYIYVLKQTWVQLLNILLVYFVSLSVFPALQANIKPLDNIISEKYFTPVFCFLFFNLFASIGNYMAQLIRRPGPDNIIYFALLRVLFVPFFLLCNFNPDERKWSILIKSDWIYVIVGVFLALSSGYLSSLCMMYVPRCVSPKHASTAAMLGALVTILGILAGINFSLIYPWLINL